MSAGDADAVVRWDSCRLDFLLLFGQAKRREEKGRAGGISMSLEFLVLFFQEKSTENCHEHYPEFKIINMNARLYDPVIARFFSPDNYVVDNEGTQDFNRYSYSRNCPLMYTDPTGNLYNPIYDKHGIPLGETSEGFTGVPLIYEGTNKVEWSTMTAEKATKKYGLTQLQKTDLSAEAFSKIYTHILEKGGFFISKLMGKAVAVRNGEDIISVKYCIFDAHNWVYLFCNFVCITATKIINYHNFFMPIDE